MTTLTSYAELKQNIQDHAKRDDILDNLDLFIDLAERDIWDAVRIRDMEVRATASTSTSDRFIQLPTGFIAMRQLQITVDDVLYDMIKKCLDDNNHDTKKEFEYANTVTH